MGGCCKRPGRRKQISRKQKGGTQNKDQLAAKVLSDMRRQATAGLRSAGCSADTPQREDHPADEPQETEQQPRKRTRFEMPQDEQRRWQAIQEIYINMGMPDESKWHGKDGTVS